MAVNWLSTSHYKEKKISSITATLSYDYVTNICIASDVSNANTLESDKNSQRSLNVKWHDSTLW